MSNKIKAFTVVMKEDVSEEYAKAVSDAIRLYDGVLEVEVIESDITDFVAHSRERSKITDKLLQLIKDL